MIDKARAYLQSGLEQQNLTAFEEPLWGWLQLLKRWNKAYNLVAAADDETLISRHIFDSLSVRPFVDGRYNLDIGSGAGLPGMLLAVTMPDTEWTLLDSNGKKTRFCEQAAHELGLKQIKVVQARVEAHQPDQLYDSIICRAYDQADSFVRQTRHLLADGGQLLAMKGRIDEGEKNRVEQHGFRLRVAALDVPQQSAQRHVMILKK